jgi:hypothetical protein
MRPISARSEGKRALDSLLPCAAKPACKTTLEAHHG